jgi:hypothetical protein
MTLVRARIDHLFVLCCLLPLPDLKSYRDNQILLDLLAIKFLRCCIEKGRHYRSFRNISWHHAAAIPSRNGTSGFEDSRKAVRFAAVGERQGDMIICCIGYSPLEGRAVVVFRVIVVWSSAILSRHADWQESDNREECHNA